MEWLYHHTQIKLGVFSVIGAFLVTFSNLICIPWEMTFYDESEYMNIYGAYLFRLLFFIGVIWVLLEFNLRGLKYFSFWKRFWGNFAIVAGSYLLFALICKLFDVSKIDCTRYSVYVQFLVVFVFSLFFGHIMALYMERHRRELEIERLQAENQRSRCEALANQINPHFFFNSLNSLSALIRKKDEEKTLAFLNKLSDVFRYTLQSDKKELVTAEDLPYIIADVLRYDLAENPVRILNYSLSLAQGLHPAASLKIEINGCEYEQTSVGDGQYDAFMRALRQIYKHQLGREFPMLRNYTVSIPPGGRTDAFVQTIITWEMGGKVFKTRGLDADQTEAAIKATIKMLNIIEPTYNDHGC